MKIVRHGITREVLLVGGYAIKLPCVRYGWRFFLMGLLANIQEKNWWDWTGRDARLCPVLFYVLTGAAIVMPRCDPMSDEEFDALKREDYSDLPCDFKADNFGRYKGRVVLLDYGSDGRHERKTETRASIHE